MSVYAVGWQIHQSAIQNARNIGEYSIPISSIARNISKVALPAIALFAMSNLPGADAGPMAYGLCVEVCFVSLAWCPPLLPACVFGCLPLLGAPTP